MLLIGMVAFGLDDLFPGCWHLLRYAAVRIVFSRNRCLSQTMLYTAASYLKTQRKFAQWTEVEWFSSEQDTISQDDFLVIDSLPVITYLSLNLS